MRFGGFFMNRNSKERQAKIMDLLKEQEVVKTKELMELFQTTSETIRKDLLHLEKLGLVEKGHGFAKISPSYIEAPVTIRRKLNSMKKNSIAETAIHMIPNGSVIFLDGGSTSFSLAKLLVQKDQVTVITTSLPIADLITSKTSNIAFLANGFVKKGALTVKGPYTVESLAHFKTDFAFMGTNGMLYHDGATCKDYDDIPIKTAAINNTQNAVLLCDSQKFSSGAIMEYAKWEDFSYLITDTDVSEEIKTRIRAKTKLILASV